MMDVVLVPLVGVMKLSLGSEFTITSHSYAPLSMLLSSGLNTRFDMKLDCFPDCDEGDTVTLSAGNVVFPRVQVKSTITMMSSTLVRVTVQVRLRAVPAYMN